MEAHSKRQKRQKQTAAQRRTGERLQAAYEAAQKRVTDVQAGIDSLEQQVPPPSNAQQHRRTRGTTTAPARRLACAVARAPAWQSPQRAPPFAASPRLMHGQVVTCNLGDLDLSTIGRSGKATACT